MNKYLIAILLAMVSLPLSADFLVQNNSDIEFWGNGMNFWHDKSVALVQLSSIPARSTQNVWFRKGWTFFPDAYVEFWTKREEGGYQLKIRIGTEGYWNLLKNAKKYLPTFIISLDQAGKPIINGPKDEKELKEAIEKIRKETLKTATQEIHESTKLPHKTGGICGIAAEYFMEAEEEPKKE